MRLFLGLTFFYLVATSLIAADSSIDDRTIHAPAKRQGLYAAISAGQLIFTGTDRLNYKDGYVVGLKAGYDVMKYLGAELVFKFSGHDASTNAVSQGRPTSFFVYQYLAQLKGAYPLTQRFHLDAGIGGGLWSSNKNMSPRIGQANKGIFYGELGCEYFFRTRGLSMGVDPSFGTVVDLKGVVVQLTGFLRYTF